jgi:hypothetical protein
MFYSYRRDAKNTKDHFFFASRQLYNFNADRFSFAVLSTGDLNKEMQTIICTS